MSTSSKIQQRGICQCCGRQQAVLASGRMSKHGYTVEEGWFSGVCSGHDYAPMQVSVEQTKAMIKSVAVDVADLRARADLFESCKLTPQVISGASSKLVEGRYVTLDIPFAEGSPRQQADARSSMVYNLRRRAQMGEDWINTMERLMVEYFGKALLEVKKEAGPAPIVEGESRQYRGAKVTAHRVVGARVIVKLGSGATMFLTTRAWRALPVA